MSLNIWRYDGDWKSRMERILEAVGRERPDMLFMQEVFDDQRHQGRDGSHQAEQLNRRLGYRNAAYDIVAQLSTEAGKPVDEPAFDGMLCLTDLEITGRGVIRLKRQEMDRHYRAVQVIQARAHGREVTFYHVHYSNTDEWGRMHLEETRDYARERGVEPIILGDLNILYPDVIREVMGPEFESSYDFKQYISYPSKGEVLDYIILPRKSFGFDSVRADYEGCSDHLALVADVHPKG